MIKHALLAAIRFYQQVISPRKGFCCAYRLHTHRAGCSGIGFRAVRRYGAFAGLLVLEKRMRLCGVAHRRYSTRPAGPLSRQRGFCDLSCDFPLEGCLPDVSCADVSNGLQCCDCGSCYWPTRREDHQEEKYVYIPPQSSLQRRGT